MKRILVTTDLSARSDRAIDRALLLAREHAAALTLMHVVDAELPAPLAENLRRDALEYLRRHLDSAPMARDLNVAIDVVLGTSHRAILERAEAESADLLVMGLHREDLLKDLFGGTTVERVIRHGARPVLVVRERPAATYRRLVVGVDYSPSSRRAVEFVREAFPSAQLHLVHAYDMPFAGMAGSVDDPAAVAAAREQLQESFSEEQAQFLDGMGGGWAPRIEVVQGPVARVLQEQVRRLQADLLVTGTQGRTGLARALLGSVAADLLRNPPCDVLAVRLPSS